MKFKYSLQVTQLLPKDILHECAILYKSISPLDKVSIFEISSNDSITTIRHIGSSNRFTYKICQHTLFSIPTKTAVAFFQSKNHCYIITVEELFAILN